jgi:hypothetical protein
MDEKKIREAIERIRKNSRCVQCNITLTSAENERKK